MIYNRPHLRICLIAIALLPTVCSAEQKPRERPEWAHFFKDAGVEGTVIVADERSGGGGTQIFNAARAQHRYPPASTFKIPHTLFALDAGLVRDEFQVFPWDGKKRWIDSWNHEQDLRSAMRNSVVWVYQNFAHELGEEREGLYLHKTSYGNADPTGADPFWVDGNLRISAEEQITFLRRLYRNELPFRVEHQRLLKDIMINEADRKYILRAKTGWSGTLGWWVGWVEWPTGPVFFALNIDTPKRLDALPQRETIVRAVLQSLNALPLTTR